MGAKPVQISLDTALLDRIDALAEVRKNGRSAFIRAAIELYLSALERAEVDHLIQRAYRGQADPLLQEVEDLLQAQAWPED